MSKDRVRKRERRKKHAIIELVAPQPIKEKVHEKALSYMDTIAEAPTWKKLEDSAKKLLKLLSAPLSMGLAPVCKFYGFPITIVDATQELVRLMCRQIGSFQAPQEGIMPSGGGHLDPFLSFVRGLLKEMTESLADSLVWLTHKDFWKDFKTATRKAQHDDLEVQECLNLKKVTYRQWIQETSKTFMSLPKDKRDTFVAGLTLIASVIKNIYDQSIGRKSDYNVNMIEEICTKKLLDAIRTIVSLVPPTSLISQTFVRTLAKTVSVLWKNPHIFYHIM
jgi:hypothetical protein